MTDEIFLYKDETCGWTVCDEDFVETARERYNLPVKRVDMDEAEEIELQDKFVATND